MSDSDSFVFYFILSLIAAAVALLADYFAAKEFAAIAEKKGYSDPKYFWWSFLLPSAGYLMVIALPNLNGREIGTKTPITSETAPAQTTRPAQVVRGCSTGVMDVPKRSRTTQEDGQHDH